MGLCSNKTSRILRDEWFWDRAPICKLQRKKVLRRANVPILNVKYDDDACGPYRDWQYQEGMIEANGNDVGAGFRLCPSSKNGS